MLLNFFVSQKFVHASHDADGTQTGGIRTFLTNRRWISFSLLLSWVE